MMSAQSVNRPLAVRSTARRSPRRVLKHLPDMSVGHRRRRCDEWSGHWALGTGHWALMPRLVQRLVVVGQASEVEDDSRDPAPALLLDREAVVGHGLDDALDRMRLGVDDLAAQG